MLAHTEFVSGSPTTDDTTTLAAPHAVNKSRLSALVERELRSDLTNDRFCDTLRLESLIALEAT
jgi:hypothetical protein